VSTLERLLAPQFSQARERLVFGVVTAKVTKINDDNTYELSYLTMGDDEPSSPARVMMPMAGGKRGTYFHPLVGDEVVVAFELGDTNQPIILGGVWNENDKYPDQAKASPDNDVRTIVSRSGHELTFDDSSGAEKVTIKTQGGHQIELDDTPGQGKITVRSNGGRSLVLDDTPSGSATLSTPSGCEVQCDDAGGSLTISAPTSITLESTTISLRAAAGITLSTTNTVVASLVTIDGTPYSAHTHWLGNAATGPIHP
jgi:phage baseplate assembly protein gpV